MDATGARAGEPDAGPWRLSRDVVLTATEHGAWSAQAGLSHGPVWVSGPLCSVLGLFNEPTSLDTVRASPAALEAAGATGERLDDVLAAWAAKGLIVSAQDGSGTTAAPLFGRPSIHIRMLTDQVRTLAFRYAIEKHARDAVMLEIGCGSGVLACFAARAGARHVYAIEETQMVEVARKIAHANGLADRITFLTGNSRDIELPEPVDVIYGELIGTNPLEEGILTYLPDATERFLKPAGGVIPAELTVRVCGVDSSDIRRLDRDDERLHAIADGAAEALALAAEPLARAVREETARRVRQRRVVASLADGANGTVLTDEADLATFDLANSGDLTPTTAHAGLRCERDGTLNAIAVSFRATLDEGLALTTSPRATHEATSWGGQFLMRVDERAVRRGCEVHVSAAIDPFHSPQLTLLDLDARIRPSPPAAKLSWEHGSLSVRRAGARGRVTRPLHELDAIARSILVPAGSVARRLTFDSSATELLTRIRHGFTREFRDVVYRHGQDKVVLEVGSHGAVLACWAAKAGARRVYAAIENRHRRLSEALIAANGLDHLVRLIDADSLHEQLDDDVDVLVGEIGPHGPLGDRLLARLIDARPVLKPGGRVIPSDVEVLACGAHAPSIEHAHARGAQLAGRLDEVGATHDLDLAALDQAYASENTELARTQPVHEQISRAGRSLGALRPLTTAARVARLRLDEPHDPDPVVIVQTVISAGLRNAMITGFTARLDDRTAIDAQPWRSTGGRRGQLLSALPPARVRSGDVLSTEAAISWPASVAYTPID